MRVLVLGSAAGGGVPQWNCRCPVCALAWEQPERVQSRTQTSVAVSADGGRWVILDAAPELRNQIQAQPVLHPKRPGRSSPIAAVVLTSGEIDHIAGLLTLREGHSFTILGTSPTLANLDVPLFDVLPAERVMRRTLVLDAPVNVAGLAITAFAVPGKVPLYREAGAVPVGQSTEDVVGLEIEHGGRRLAYVPGAAHLPDRLRQRLGDADLLMLDGTTFTDDELIDLGLSAKTAGRMGHLPITGQGGSLHAFAKDTRARKVYIHLNNTNPVLVEGSVERDTVTAVGWEVAHDGQEFVL